MIKLFDVSKKELVGEIPALESYVTTIVKDTKVYSVLKVVEDFDNYDTIAIVQQEFAHNVDRALKAVDNEKTYATIEVISTKHKIPKRKHLINIDIEHKVAIVNTQYKPMNLKVISYERIASNEYLITVGDSDCVEPTVEVMD